jgi:hypothetical protein
LSEVLDQRDLSYLIGIVNNKAVCERIVLKAYPMGSELISMRYENSNPRQCTGADHSKHTNLHRRGKFRYK